MQLHFQSPVLVISPVKSLSLQCPTTSVNQTLLKDFDQVDAWTKQLASFPPASNHLSSLSRICNTALVGRVSRILRVEVKCSVRGVGPVESCLLFEWLFGFSD